MRCCGQPIKERARSTNAVAEKHFLKKTTKKHTHISIYQEQTEKPRNPISDLIAKKQIKHHNAVKNHLLSLVAKEILSRENKQHKQDGQYKRKDFLYLLVNPKMRREEFGWDGFWAVYKSINMSD